MRRSYPETVEFLYGLLPMYQRTGAFAGKYDLSRTEALLAALGDPHRRLRAVHVAGTNGKGSVSSAIASLCTAAGRRVGLYTSPHYVDYRERVRIDGAMVPETYVVDFVHAHEALIAETGASFFEFTVALAFSYFAAEGVDLAVVEVGLGGRLDSTNVLDPLVSVITNIDLDHTEVLGDTRAAIAVEKAGIIKPGRPVVIGRHQSETQPVFRRIAAERGAALHEAWTSSAAELQALDWSALSLQGPFARENARTALAAYSVLRKRYPLPPAYLDALTRMRELSGYTGRFTTAIPSAGGGPRVIVDAGHNEAAWARIVPAVVAEAGAGPCDVVCGFVRGKTPLSFARLWPPATRFYVADMPALPRNKPRAETMAELEEGGIAARGFGSVPEAYAAALKEAATDGLVYVGGSSFVAGDFLAATSPRPA